MSNDTDSATLEHANPLAEQDPEIWKLIGAEQQRQENTLEMIASENHTSQAVMAAAGSCLTNKYCEGYPGKRYYSGCEYYDQIENIAIDRAKKLFNCEYANVQPHSGANANTAVFFAMMNPGDTYASIELSDGGHLTHGAPVNISGKWFNPVHYPLVYDHDREDYGYLDYEAIEKLCQEHQPKILICGFSAHPRIIDFERFRKIADDCGAWLMCDMAHIAGLVAGGAHPSPFPYCDVVTTTTHKTLRGPRGGLILTNNEDLAKKFDKAVFPGTQGGPLMHVIAGKAVNFAENLKPEFKDYAQQIVTNSKTLGAELMNHGYHLVSNGTDNHLLLVDLRPTAPETSGKQAALWLEQAGIITNKNTVPKDERSPFQCSGLRLGTAALTTRGLKENDMKSVAQLVDRAIKSEGDDQTLNEVRSDVVDLCKQFPMPH
jgi:glycine hydroxymethyltransferase